MDTISLEAVVAAFYKGALGRAPLDGEVEFYVNAYSRGTSLDELATLITTSSEARHLQRDRLLDSLTLGEATATLLGTSIAVRADDVLNVIALAYETQLGRHPAFREVGERYSALLDGATLAGQIADVAHSAEAVLYAERKAERFLETRNNFARLLQTAYSLVLQRAASEIDIDHWHRVHSSGMSYPDIVTAITQSEEARQRASNNLENWENGTFVQLLYEVILQQGATPGDIERYRGALDGGMTRLDLLASFFNLAAGEATSAKKQFANDPQQAIVFGRFAMLAKADWQRRRDALARGEPATAPLVTSRFMFTSKATPLVSIITSLYRGGLFIEAFLENLTSQSIFVKHCELLIIDANSPEGEYERAAPYLDRFKNIHYKRCLQAVGIYQAWNIGVTNARGAYCTNANLDDCRRHDSLERQASTLDALDFVDIVYQDVLYSFAKNLPFEDIERLGFSTDLPLVSRYNLLEFNSPHNAPMWRKRLHDDVGLFNESYRSAGDCDFWIRCVLAGKIFYKINEPHVAYYVNPRGLSTRADTSGALEMRAITKTFNRQLVSPLITIDEAAFAGVVAERAGAPVEVAGRYAMAQSALRAISAASRIPER